ncbi:ArsR/SmtB family transcription factor [Acidobacteriota bacterium]
MLNKKSEEIKKRFEENEKVCEKVLNIFSLISNKTRFRILCLLKEGDFCVNDIVALIQLGKISNISQQLRLLSMADILEKRREKKQVFYHLKDEKIRKMIVFLEENYLNINSSRGKR